MTPKKRSAPSPRSRAATRGMETFRIDHPHNEASALLTLENQSILDAFGWSEAFWIVSDEKPAHCAVGALGRSRRGRSRWEVKPLAVSLHGKSSRKPTEDAETMARAGGWIYVFGSQFGAKSGPLEPTRHFVARFNESLVRCDGDGLAVKMEVVRPAFRLHRLINDALADSAIELIAPYRHERSELVDATRERGEKKNKRWADRVRGEDRPINVEGATFLPDGRLLLGLRYPVSAEGQPLLVEIDGIDRLFDGGAGAPAVMRVVRLENLGSPDRPAGVRELDQMGAEIHVITGDLDSDADESQVIADHPEGADATVVHSVLRWNGDGAQSIPVERVHAFDRSANVEGLCVRVDGTVWYVHDSDIILLQRRAAQSFGRASGGRKNASRR